MGTVGLEGGAGVGSANETKKRVPTSGRLQGPQGLPTWEGARAVGTGDEARPGPRGEGGAVTCRTPVGSRGDARGDMPGSTAAGNTTCGPRPPIKGPSAPTPGVPPPRPAPPRPPPAPPRPPPGPPPPLGRHRRHRRRSRTRRRRRRSARGARAQGERTFSAGGGAAPAGLCGRGDSLLLSAV